MTRHPDRRSATAGAEAGDVERAVTSSMLAPNPGRLAAIEAEADIARSPEEVFDCCSDPTHESEWNLKMTGVEQLTDGPIGVGTR